jgi:hypothetical protein
VQFAPIGAFEISKNTFADQSKSPLSADRLIAGLPAVRRADGEMNRRPVVLPATCTTHCSRSYSRSQVCSKGGNRGWAIGATRLAIQQRQEATMPKTTKAAVVREFCQPLVVGEAAIPEPGPSPIRIKSPVVSLGASIALLFFGAAAEARDMTGAWVTDATTCKKVFTGTGSKLAFAKDADVYGSGFIYEKNRLKGKNASCVIKTQKQDGDILHLVALCANDVTLGMVQFSLRIHDDNQITRFFSGVSELDIKYYRCSP